MTNEPATGDLGSARKDCRVFREEALDQWQLAASIERCRVEIAEIEALLLAGHPDVQGLCLALSDWSGELRLLERGVPDSSEPSAPTSSRPG